MHGNGQSTNLTPQYELESLGQSGSVASPLPAHGILWGTSGDTEAWAPPPTTYNVAVGGEAHT